MTPKSELIARAQQLVCAEAQAVAALVEQIDERLLPALELMATCKGHVLVTGAGTSAALAQRMAHLLACCGVPALYICASDCLHGGAGAITGNDVAYVISRGGQSAEVNQFAALARQRGAAIIVQTEDAHSPLARMADHVYAVRTVGDVDLHGVIATGSSLVNCAAGDALCAMLLQMTGHTRADFLHMHPGGAVGKLLAGEQDAQGDDRP